MGLHWGGCFKEGPLRILTQHQGLQMLFWDAAALHPAHADGTTYFLLCFQQLAWGTCAQDAIYLLQAEPKDREFSDKTHTSGRPVGQLKNLIPYWKNKMGLPPEV